MFHYALKTHDFLMLASSESVGSFGGLFSAVDRKYKIYSKKGDASRVDIRTQVDLGDTMSKVASLEGRSVENPSVHNIQSEMERVILSRFSPPGVLVDSD